MSVMSGKQAIVSADMQRRAKKIAMQASKLADEARPMTETATKNAKRGADAAAEWARPRVDRSRAWMALRAARGSVAVEKTVAPRVSAMMATAAKKLDPPKRRRRLPKILAGVVLLAAGAAAAGAIALRNRRMLMGTMPPPPKPPAPGGAAGQETIMDQAAGDDRSSSEADVGGFSHTR